MGGLDNQMFGGVDKSAFSLGVAAPENENEVFFGFGQTVNDGIGESLPALVLMRTGQMGPNSQGSVEKENSLLGPAFKVARPWHFHSQIGFDFFVNIDERRRRYDAVRNREGEAVGLAGAVVGILAEDDDPYLIDRDAIEGVENKFWGRVDGAVFIFVFDKFGEFSKIGFIKLIFQ